MMLAGTPPICAGSTTFSLSAHRAWGLVSPSSCLSLGIYHSSSSLHSPSGSPSLLSAWKPSQHLHNLIRVGTSSLTDSSLILVPAQSRLNSDSLAG
ncbi:hypothetical protein PF005_g29746 [Phytophthora fragariae]|uniref:Uncharacterized protein n=1 Tax=Phytophthora fragariae TaxID=53985 RepID=A0A6A3DNH8_9STRA|nr:hypothetical protein PF009_g26842 [Phytophthora fragariae]KAE9071002.1 hypothetical protein PF006_g29242 [Phytophthora fragariae]KAE9165105.1 hypothetical protein PF005_g29746 [Phytophthora fragariae]KAE9273519.1 hypothetical protein PF001_g27473 [Phytophthora fragariae]